MLNRKGNLIEIYKVTPEGLSSALQVPIYGNICCMKIFGENVKTIFILKNKV
jgi:hypothetical protein